MKNISAIATISAGLLLSSTTMAASVIGGDLLTTSYAAKLTTWLGKSNLDFTNISNLTIGDAASLWHADVDGKGPVVSIYDVEYDGKSYLIGGYSSIGHTSTRGYRRADDNFIFNLTLSRKADVRIGTPKGNYAQYDAASYFATFGGGHDLYGGFNRLGNLGYSNNNSYVPDGSLGYSYKWTLGEWMFAIDSTAGTSFEVKGIESYTFAPSTDVSAVPVPAAAWLFMPALLGFLGMRRKASQSAT